MRLKLDENLGVRDEEQFRAAGHDVATVEEQGLCSASDQTVISACRNEKRCLVSLDLDFANPFLFRPSEYTGIAVLRLPAKSSADDLFAAMDTLIAELGKSPIRGRLWIVERGRIRQYRPEDEETA